MFWWTFYVNYIPLKWLLFLRRNASSPLLLLAERAPLNSLLIGTSIPAKSRNLRGSPEMARDLQVSRNCKQISRNCVNLIDVLFFRKKPLFLSYFPKCVSLPMNITQCGVKTLDLASGDNGKFLLHPPPPPPNMNMVGEHGKTLLRKNSATTPPPPTESRRLLEMTEKTQENQQAQLGSSALHRKPQLPLAVPVPVAVGVALPLHWH